MNPPIATSTRLDRTLTALADPTRRSIFELVASRPRAVSDIAAHLPVSRPAVSQHLRVLKEAGLVRERREANRRLYAVDGDGLAAVREYFERFWEDALERFKAAAEAERREEERDA